MRHYLTALLLSLPFACLAEMPPPPIAPLPADEAPPVPSGTGEADELEPQVTIIKRGRDVIQEYRLNGQLYMVKITPAGGVPYYLVDQDGDGDMETRMHDFNSNQNLPRWVLFRW